MNSIIYNSIIDGKCKTPTVKKYFKIPRNKPRNKNLLYGRNM